jgi:adenine-specific DNA-methyltransferase
MSKKTKLELTWIGKENRPLLEPRILLEGAAKSYHAKARVSQKDIFDNILIHGDNLLALKALEREFSARVRCVYIDPPYNTGSAFSHYDDGVEHSVSSSFSRANVVSSTFSMEEPVMRNMVIWLGCYTHCRGLSR